MAGLSRSAYSDAFQHNDPGATGRLLRARVQAGKEVNDRLADYFSERAEVRARIEPRCGMEADATLRTFSTALRPLANGKLPIWNARPHCVNNRNMDSLKKRTRRHCSVLSPS